MLVQTHCRSLTRPVLAAVAALAMVTGARLTDAAAPDAADLYVSPAGNDAWSGRYARPVRGGTDGPLASPGRAREAVRALRRSQAEPGRLTVMLRQGLYALSQPLVFTPEDSGSPGAEVTWCAYPGERPVLSGGVTLSEWRVAGDGLWVTDLPDLGPAAGDVRGLFVNGQRRPRCRLPNAGYLRADGPLRARPARNTPEWKEPEARIGVHYAPGDLASWPDAADGTAVLFHAWTASVHWIDRIDETDRTLRFTAGSGWPMGYWEKNQRYYIENVRAALDAPGEWYVSYAERRLYYKPLPGERLAGFRAIAPRLETVLELRGDAAAGIYVEDMVFRGLALAHTAFLLPRDRCHDGQAAVNVGSAVVTHGALNCRFEDLEISRVGGYGLHLGAGTRNCTVTRSEIHDLGAGGVLIGTVGSEPPATACYGNTVDDCFIHDGGHLAKAGIGVWIGRSSGHRVSHNDICDFDYTGVSVGWSWGYAPSSANHNLVESNHIHHIGNGVLSDLAGIYTLGISPGTILRANVIHDISAYSYGGWGLYTDEGSSEILMEKNIVYRTKSGAFHQHYGRENTLCHNILAFSQEAAVIRSREEAHRSFTFEKNVVITDNGQPLGGNWNNGNYRLDGNLYWDTAGNELAFAGGTFEEWREDQGQDQHSLIENPGLRDPADGDFRPRSRTVLDMMAIEPLQNPEEAGLYGPRSWTRRPEQTIHRPLDPAMQPPKTTSRAALRRDVVDGFEATPVGQTASEARTSEAGPATIRVTAEQAAPGGSRSLRFADANGLEHEWQPHLYYTVNWRNGHAAIAFDVYLEPGARLCHEWRHYSTNYVAGPEIRFREEGTLTSRDRVLMSYPTRTWIHVTMTCPLGDRAATDGFELTVTVPGQSPQRFERLPLVSPAWRHLTWIGFISEARHQSIFYVDNLDARRERP